MGLSTRRARRHIVLAALAASLLSLLIAGTASAARVSAHDGTITFVAAPGEKNDLELFLDVDEVLFVDAGATITPGPGCERADEGVACAERVPFAGTGSSLSLHLGDRGDRVGLDDCHGERRPITIWGSRGADSIGVGSCVGAHLVVHGGVHDDVIRTSLNHSGFSRLNGGDGRDRLAVNEGGLAFLHGGPNHDDLSYNTYIDDVGAPTDYVDVHGDAGNDTIRPADLYKVESTVFGGSGKDTLAPGWGPIEFDMAACATCDLERVIGTSEDDIIYGDDDTNWIWSGDGNDTVDPRGGTDYVYAGDGDDTVTANDGTWDTIRCGAGLLDSVFADRRESLGECEIVHRTG